MAQNYLQLKMQSNKQLAIALTNSLRDMHEDHMATLEKVKQGTQRLVSYGACLMPDEYYRNACRDTWREDKRLVLALGEIYNRKDVTLDMVEIYFRKTLNRLGEQKSKDLITNIHNLLGKAAEHASAKASKLALSFTLANLIINSKDFKQNHIRLVNSFSTWFVNGATLYSKAQVAASAANRLKFQDPQYYQALYKENIEMLYFLIEPQMSEIIYQVNSGDNNEQVIGDALYEILRK
ncbi:MULTISPECIES: hypothetical protein [Enterobacter]|jgi:hypothetical protein|uniref:Transcriptional regulator n=2 Tax=Enterobacter TaxID=547 RepID=A0AAU7FRJ8_9ENTR|nr:MULTISPECIES: hypothetical protein [Enterobacter]KJW96110.1 hypothetical protein RZ87_23680 [Enterobacter roggenkampii]MCB5947525.1 hypothetical protein [Enterobacter sp. TCD1-1]MEB6576105.1 hypothetical protein [Enterobacter quasiroggenkampii]WFC80673.1 hypothetical protein OM418_11365 [Enterobacter quasiroggenkampii]SEO45290.1 hypothetical protein SAMN03159286_0764 [Enterobacter sp. NFIX58]